MRTADQLAGELGKAYQAMREHPRLRRLPDLIEESVAYPDVRLPGMALHLAIDPSYLNRLLRRHTRLTCHQLILRRRLLEALRLVQRRGWPLYRIARESGFASYNTFARTWKAVVGCCPGPSGTKRGSASPRQAAMVAFW